MARGIRQFLVKALWAPEHAALMAEHNKLVDEVAEIKTKLGAHTHGGVTAGTDTSAAPAAITYANPEAAKVA